MPIRTNRSMSLLSQAKGSRGSAPTRFLLALSGCTVAATLAFNLAGMNHLSGIGVTAGLALLAMAALSSPRFQRLAFALWVLAFAACAISYPRAFTSWGGFELKQAVIPLVQLIMFGMGTTLAFGDFARVIRMPKAVLIGLGLQYTVMPLMGWTYAALFGLQGEVAVGLILYGSCAGGVSSNVITYIAGANLALSVTMTACSTLMAPLMTPFAMKMLAGQYLPIEMAPMMISILKMILAPVLAGLLVNRYAHRFATWASRWLPGVSMWGICTVIAITIALSRDDLMAVAAPLLGAAISHNTTGFALGYWSARVFGLNRIDSRAVSIEVGMQNGGMATGLAFDVLRSSAAALPSAVEGPWAAVSGAGLASYWRRSRRPAQASPEDSRVPAPESSTG